jgi:hypothetical protein
LWYVVRKGALEFLRRHLIIALVEKQGAHRDGGGLNAETYPSKLMFSVYQIWLFIAAK